MHKKLIAVIFTASFIFIAGVNVAKAGFGISPPYVKSNQIVPGTHYEQKITLLRSSSEEDLKAEITVNAPEIKNWITINKGDSFLLPKGELQVPMTVNVDPPKNAELGNYQGYINIRIVPADEKKGSGVAIALGARIDVDLTLTNVTFADFLVRSVSIPSVERLGRPWNWKYWAPLYDWLFYKIRIAMNIENTGNVETAPSKVHLDVYDIGETKLLESTDDNDIEKLKPGVPEGQPLEAQLRTKLPKGQYWGRVKIYKDNEIINSYKIVFTVADPGELGAEAVKLGIWPWVVMGGLILLGLIIIIILVRIRIWKYFIFTIGFILKPVYKKFTGITSAIKAKFWKWIHAKASEKTTKYDDKK